MDPVVTNVLGALAGAIAGLVLAGAARRQRPAELPVPVRTGTKRRRRRKA